MGRIKQYLEQLHYAASFIAKNNALDARIALLLLDNLLEIAMRNKIIACGPVFSTIARNELPHLKPYSFPEKVKDLTRKYRFLEPDSARILIVCHEIRNKAYHHNILSDELIPLSILLFHEACNLMPILWGGKYLTIFDGEDRECMKNLLGIENGHLPKENSDWRPYDWLPKEQQDTLPKLPLVLYKNVIARTRSLKEDIDFIINNTHYNSVEQLLHIYYADKKETNTKRKDHSEFFKFFKLGIPVDFVSQIRKLARSMINIDRIGKVICLHYRISMILNPIENDFKDYVDSIWREIQLQIDESRGK